MALISTKAVDAHMSLMVPCFVAPALFDNSCLSWFLIFLLHWRTLCVFDLPVHVYKHQVPHLCLHEAGFTWSFCHQVQRDVPLNVLAHQLLWTCAVIHRKKGWIRGNTKLGPVSEVTTCCLQGKFYEFQKMKQETSEMQFEEYALKLNARAFAS